MLFYEIVTEFVWKLSRDKADDDVLYMTVKLGTASTVLRVRYSIYSKLTLPFLVCDDEFVQVNRGTVLYIC